MFLKLIPGEPAKRAITFVQRLPQVKDILIELYEIWNFWHKYFIKSIFRFSV